MNGRELQRKLVRTLIVARKEVSRFDELYDTILIRGRYNNWFH